VKKNLAEMSLEELWELFPIVLKEHNPQYGEWYESEKADIISALNGESIIRINHIGSTAVNGLIAKPTVDILLEVDESCDIPSLISVLEKHGWLLMSDERGPGMKLIFNKGYTPEGFAKRVYHLHVRYFGDWNELYFRDCLIAHPEVASEYGQLKMCLLKIYEHDRDGYTEAKKSFILKYTKQAKSEYADRYKSKK
jgi:GrpB-like predicted nucleotidyltransferase (UPF0157 family)